MVNGKSRWSVLRQVQRTLKYCLGNSWSLEKHSAIAQCVSFALSNFAYAVCVPLFEAY